MRNIPGTDLAVHSLCLGTNVFGWTADEAFALMRTVWEPDAVWSRFIAAALRSRITTPKPSPSCPE